MTKTKSRNSPNSITLSVSVDRKLRSVLEDRAVRDRRSASFIVRDAIELYLRLETAPADLRKAIEQHIGVPGAA